MCSAPAWTSKRSPRPESVPSPGPGPIRPLRASAHEANDRRSRGASIRRRLRVALACDLIVASDDAQFALPEVKRGLVAAAVAPCGFHADSDRNRDGACPDRGTYRRDRAAGLGLVNRVAPPGEALDTALAMASTIANNAPMAVRTAKLRIDRRSMESEEAIVNQAAYTDAARNPHDAAEGTRAFVEKRAPAWTNT